METESFSWTRNSRMEFPYDIMSDRAFSMALNRLLPPKCKYINTKPEFRQLQPRSTLQEIAALGIEAPPQESEQAMMVCNRP